MTKFKRLLKTQQDIDEFLQWVAALRSGDYNRATGVLQFGTSYCCLGVACSLFGKNLDLTEAKQLAGGLPTMQRVYGAILPDWLVNINDYVQEFTVISISSRNDGGYTFPQMADFLMDFFKDQLTPIEDGGEN